jgi:hypothetical protein
MVERRVMKRKYIKSSFQRLVQFAEILFSCKNYMNQFYHFLTQVLCHNISFFWPTLILSFFVSFFLISSIVNTYQLSYAQEDFNFAAVGDWGCDSDTDDTVTNIRDKSPELVLGLGDYSYRSTATCWLNKIKPIDSITKINIGNEDRQTSKGLDQYMNNFGLTKQYYSYDYQNVHILTMRKFIIQFLINMM